MNRSVHFQVNRREELAAAIKEIRFGMLVTFTGTEILASHIPMLLRESDGDMRIEGHLAHANNNQWKQVEPAVDALAVFTGPHAYVSPSWYPSKTDHQRVVPTWNYITVQATGPLSFIDDRDWLLRHVTALTEHNEAGQSEPWHVSDAPADFVEKQCGAIVGFRLEVRKLEGAWKMAQHRSEADRLGVIAGLNDLDDLSARAVAAEMARLEGARVQEE